jgi:polyisoprenoid-binding protein YceI
MFSEVAMSFPLQVRFFPIAFVLAVVAASAVTFAQARTPLAVDTARVTIAGASNVHAYTASTTTVRVTRVQLGAAVTAAALWDEVVKPGGLEAFEIAIPAATLSSPKDGLDKNMHKALKVQEHADITFRLVRLEPLAAGAFKAHGVLRIAGVEREVALDLKTERREATLVVKGELALLMTDYGIKPPTAMLGMLKTDPKVTVTFETVLAVPLT